MAVVVQCFKCGAILELDEGFRGGVCRCSTCGSLLQVPRADVEEQHSPGRISRPAAPTVNPSPPLARPDVPPARPVPKDVGPSSGKFDTTSPGADFGGSSSGMGRVHTTRPISHKNEYQPDATSQSKSVNRIQSIEHVQDVPPPPVPGTLQPQRKEGPKTPPVIAAILIALVAGVVGLMIYAYFFR